MISLLHEKAYETLGNIEIRSEDWQRIRKLGAIRFVTQCCSVSYASRFGGLLLLSTAASIHNFNKIGPTSWMLLTFGLYGVVISLIYAVRAWFRLKQRFDRDDSTTTHPLHS